MHGSPLVLVASVLTFVGCSPQPSAESASSTRRAAETEAGIETALQLELDQRAPQWLEESKVPSLAVAYLSNGTVQWTRVYGRQAEGIPANTNTLYNVASLTKPISAEVILRLVGAGRLSLDEPLSAYWIDPDIRDDPRHEKLTLRLALSHQTGFKNWRYLTDGVLRLDAEPGATFGYSGEGYEYALRFVNRKLQTEWESLATQYVFAPLAMKNTAYTEKGWFAGRLALPYGSDGKYLPPSIQNSPSAADDIYTTVGDYAAFLTSVMNREGLPAEIAAQRDSIHVINPSVVADCDATRVTRCPVRGGMGLGWEILEFPREKVLLHTGGDAGTQTIAFYFAGRRDGAVMFTNGDDGFKVMLNAIDLLFHGTDLASFAMSKR
jgi:CubicO group peptidase (beta-lactamase class C family)